MNKMRSLFLALILSLGLGAHRAEGQATEQVMTFTIVCQYMTNTFYTNAAAGITNEYQALTTVRLDTGNIAKAIAIDLAGTNWEKTWWPATILRQVNLLTGAEGIYLRTGNNATNISAMFFGTSYSNEFTADVTNIFTATNYAAVMPLFGGWRYMHPTETISNYSAADGLYYLAFASSNTSFNLFGYGQGTVHHPSGTVNGINYETNTISTEIMGAGLFNLNVTTNIFRVPTANGTPTNYSGLAHGSVLFSPPYFRVVPYP